MSFSPQVGDPLAIGDTLYRIAEHPAAPGILYGQEGRQAIVYQLVAQDDEKRALKVFKARYRLPAMVSLTDKLGPFANLSGLHVCYRVVLTPQRHGDLLRQYPDLTYAVLMPWVEGPTWMEVLLEERALTPEQSLSLARSLAETLATMEQRGLAHCDLSGSNIMLPVLAQSPIPSPRSPIVLVDVEQLYGPGLERPELLPGGSPGYAHRNAPDGLWSSTADRFAGAVLLAEMLGWCDERVREAAWGENYFDPSEMQQDNERYSVLVAALQERWGAGVATLFGQAWRSEILMDCPAFGEWLVALETRSSRAEEEDRMQQTYAKERLARASVEKADALTAMGQIDRALKELEDAYHLAPELVAETYARALVQQAAQREDAGDLEGALTSYRHALPLAPEGSALGQEIAAVADRLEAQLHGSVPAALGVISKPVVRFEYPTSKAVLWLVIMLAGWAGTLGLNRFTHGDYWFALVSWAAVGALAGIAQRLVTRGVASIRPWWILVAAVGWSGSWVLGGIAVGLIQQVWFVAPGRDVDVILRLNLWWFTAYQLSFLLNAVFNGAATVWLLRGRLVESSYSRSSIEFPT